MYATVVDAQGKLVASIETTFSFVYSVNAPYKVNLGSAIPYSTGNDPQQIQILNAGGYPLAGFNFTGGYATQVSVGYSVQVVDGTVDNSAFQLPEFPPGTVGGGWTPAALSIGSVEVGEPSAVITGDAPRQYLNLVLPPGTVGPTGPQGEPGPTGPTGPQGPAGVAGTNETAWWYGDGVPGVIVGSKPGDFYLDTVSGQVYELN